MSHSSNGRTRVAVAVAMVPLAAGFPRVAAGFFMAAGTEAHRGLGFSLVWTEWLQEGNAFEPHGLTVAMWLHEPWKETT